MRQKLNFLKGLDHKRDHHTTIKRGGGGSLLV